MSTGSGPIDQKRPEGSVFSAPWQRSIDPAFAHFLVTPVPSPPARSSAAASALRPGGAKIPAP